MLADARFAALFMGNGINPKHWWTKGAGADVALSKSLEPLALLRTRLNVVSGLFNKHATGVGIHPGQTGNILSGAALRKGAVLRGGTSVDQVLAAAIGEETAQPSLVLGSADARANRRRNDLARATTAVADSGTNGQGNLLTPTSGGWLVSVPRQHQSCEVISPRGNRRFIPQQRGEVTSAIAWENYQARFNHAFGIEAEGFSEGAFCSLPVRDPQAVGGGRTCRGAAAARGSVFTANHAARHRGSRGINWVVPPPPGPLALRGGLRPQISSRIGLPCGRTGTGRPSVSWNSWSGSMPRW